MKVRIIKGWHPVWILLPRWVKGITLYPFVFIRSRHPHSGLLLHEAVHVEQVKRLGWVRFYSEYIYQSIRYGYRNNKFEIEAREKSGYE